MHLILATQRPSVDVITGLIKANIPARISYEVSSRIDSRTILDQMGAESLLGQGDMLYLAPGTGLPTRVHGAFVADAEVHRVAEYLRSKGEPQYVEGLLEAPESGGDESAGGGQPGGEADPLYDQAVEIVLKNRRARSRWCSDTCGSATTGPHACSRTWNAPAWSLPCRATATATSSCPRAPTTDANSGVSHASGVAAYRRGSGLRLGLCGARAGGRRIDGPAAFFSSARRRARAANSCSACRRARARPSRCLAGPSSSSGPASSAGATTSRTSN